MEEGGDPFSKAWEASPQSSFPGAWSAAPPSGDPWGNKVEQEPWTFENHPEDDHINDKSEHSLDTQQLNTVFQQCNSEPQSAIQNKNNNSHTDNDFNESGFDDNFGEWSETDVLFKSGLLDQEFKTVCVTAEEDDLWSSADFTSLNLSQQNSSFSTQNADQRPEEVSKVSSIQEEVSNIDDGSGGGVSNPANINSSSTPNVSSQNKPSGGVVSQDQNSGPSGQLESGQLQLGGNGDSIKQGVSGGPSITNNSANSVTHPTLKSTAGSDGSSSTLVNVTPSVSVQPKVSNTPPSLLGATVPSENTSIIPTQNIDVSNREAALSVNAENRNSYSVGVADKLSDPTLTHTGSKSIPLYIGDTALRTLADKKEKRIMGNILDSDKEEMDKMEAVEVETQDKGEQTVPSDPGEKSAAPTVDLKESVAVKENGSDAMVNGDQGDNEMSLNDSLDTQTQTREDEFPPEENYAEDIQQETEPENVGLEENGVVESQDSIGSEDAAAGNIPVIIEKEDSSEGYGSQDADKTLDSENGTETIAPVEKEDEKLVSQDEGLASPESEDSNAVSTLESVQTIEGDVVESGNVDKGVDLVIVDHSWDFDPNIVSNGDTSVPQGVPEVIGVDDNRGTEQTQGTLELCAENKHMDRNEEEGNYETNTSFHNYTDQTDIVHDAYTGTQNISDREEGQVTKDGMSGQSDSGDVSKICGEYFQSNPNNSVPSKQVDINTTDKGMKQDTETAPQQESVLSNSHQTEPLVEFEQGSENSVGGGPEMNFQTQKEEASDLTLVNLDSEKECSAEVPVDVPAEIVTGTLGVPQLTDQPFKEPSDKGEGFEVLEGSTYPDNQAELFQECNTTSEASKSLDLNKELDINNSELGEEATVDSESGKTTEMVKPLDENVVEFVDEVLNKAMEQLSSEQTEASLESFQEKEKVADVIVNGGAEDETAVMDKKSNGLVHVEVDRSVSEEKEFSKEIDMDTSGNVKLNVNLTSENVSVGDSLGYASGGVDSSKGGVISTGEIMPEKNSGSEHVGNKGSAARSQRWSVPAGSFTNNQFSYTDQTKESSIVDVTREPSPIEKRQFRPVRFRPASSSEAKLRRTSIGVPRGWNAPPVDVLLPPVETEDTETVVQTAKEAGPSSLTSETSTSSGSSMSVQSSLSSEGWRPKDQENVFRAVPVMVTADVVEAQDSAPVEAEPRSEKTEAGATLDSSFSSHTDEKPVHLEASPVFHSIPSPSEKKAYIDEPSIPATVKRTPPLSHKVEVYEIKDAPITSPTATSMRQAFSQNRSVTEGEGGTRKKMSQAEKERQDLLAALKVRRPVKEKWQGQIEQEEKEKDKQVQLPDTSFKSLKSYEERKKINIKSKSLDLSSSGELSVARPIANSQEAEGEFNTGSSQESSFEREIRLQKEKERAFKEEQLNSVGRHRPHSLNFDGDSGDISQGELYISREEVLSPNGDTCSSGYTSGRSTPASEDASRFLSLPKHGGSGDSPMYKEYQNLLKETQDAEEAEGQRLPSREETGLRSVVQEDPIPETIPDQQSEPMSPQQKSFVQKEVKMREKKINSRVVKQNRISFVEQEVLRQKQKEEEFRKEREMRDQERSQAKPLSPSPRSSMTGSTADSRLTSPTTPEPAAKPVKAPVKQPPSKAKAVYQELQYNPKVGGGNRSSAMVKQWESKFKK